MISGSRTFHRHLLLTIIGLSTCAVYSQDDFSKTNSITILMGEAGRRNLLTGKGLEHRIRGRDSRNNVQSIQGVPCRCLEITEEQVPKGYFSFTIDPTFKDRDVAKVRIDVDYFDGTDSREGVFGVQYDANGSDVDRALTVKQVLPNIVLKGSGRWLKTTFHLSDAGFKNLQSGGGDFRLWASPPELCVSRVTVTLEPSQQPPATNEMLRFDATGEAKLREWNLQWDSGSKPSFSRQAGNQNGPRSLVIRSPGTFAAGSWRTAILLEAGSYEFVGKVRTEGIVLEPTDFRGGATLRVSGKYTPEMLTKDTDWTTKRFEFTMPTRDYVELACEFRASQGVARFDEDSLKLIRKGGRN